MRRADLGDIVRIISTPETLAAGHADRSGTCYGFTTPSATHVEVIGPVRADIAVNVAFEDGHSAWFEPSVVEIIDVGAGQEAVVGDKRFIRSPDGDWIEAPDSN